MFVILNDQKRQWLGNYMALRAVLLISLIVCSFMRVADAGTRPSVAFLSPDDSRFWQMVAGFMEQVAVDLDVDLEVQFDTDRNRFSYLRMAQQIVTAEEKPDYLIIMCKELVTTQILEQAHGQGVKVFSFNTDVPEATRAAVGMPRETLDSWIGHVVPDNVEAGRTLARLLERRAVERGLVEAGEPVPMVALTGTQDSSAARDRNEGLLNATSIGNGQLLQLVLAEWSEQQASEKCRCCSGAIRKPPRSGMPVMEWRLAPLKPPETLAGRPARM